MSTIKDVSGTAFVVAEYRAEENREPMPIYEDSVVTLFLSDASRRAADHLCSRFPAVKDMVKTRTRYFDDMLEAQLAAGIGQVVILGAGLDTRAVRKRRVGVRYFEIDDPATMELKQRCYKDACIDCGVTLIPGNYVTDGLIDLLLLNGFEHDVPTYFIWEGNVMYMPLAIDKHTMMELKRFVKRFRLSFDYLSEAIITKTTGHADMTILVRELRGDGRALGVGYRRDPQPRSRAGPAGRRKLYNRRTVSNVSRSSELFTHLPALLDMHIGTLKAVTRLDINRKSQMK